MKVSSVALQTGANVAQVHQVAIVGNGDKTLGGIDANRLSIQQRRIARGGVARMANGHRPRQLGQHIFGEDLTHQAHALDVGQPLAVSSGYAR